MRKKDFNNFHTDSYKSKNENQIYRKQINKWIQFYLLSLERYRLHFHSSMPQFFLQERIPDITVMVKNAQFASKSMLFFFQFHTLCTMSYPATNVRLISFP